MFPSILTAALQSAASSVGCNAEDLKALIEFESGWNPAAYNPSGAVGLIQFMPQTLEGMGLLSPSLAESVPDSGSVPEAVKQAVRTEFLLKYPSAELQLLGPVVSYLRKYKPYPNRQSLFMAVFYPAFRFVSPDTLFPSRVQEANPGIDTVQSYLDKVPFGTPLKNVLTLGSISIFPLAAVAAVLLYFKKRPSRRTL